MKTKYARQVIRSVYGVYASAGVIMIEERRLITIKRPAAITGQTSTADMAELEGAAVIVVESLSYRVIEKVECLGYRQRDPKTTGAGTVGDPA